jgi:hypothetical protein
LKNAIGRNYSNIIELNLPGRHDMEGENVGEDKDG